MIIEEIDIEGIAVLETENDPSVAADRDAPEALEIAAQAMQTHALDVHVVNRNGGIQAEEQAGYLIDQIGPQLASVIVLEQSPEPAMANAPEHGALVS